MPLPPLLWIGGAVFLACFILMIGILVRKRKGLTEKKRKKLVTIFLLSAGVALATTLGINAIFYGLYAVPYPGESLDSSLKLAILIGGGVLVLDAVDRAWDFYEEKVLEKPPEGTQKPQGGGVPTTKLNPLAEVPPHKPTSDIAINIQLPMARWGEPSKLALNVDTYATLRVIVTEGLKKSEPLASQGPWYVVADGKIFGPDSYDKTIQSSGIQNNQTVILTDKPLVQPKPMPYSSYIPPFAEGTATYHVEAESIARTWISFQKPNLELRAFTNRVNESETFIQVRGTFTDQYMLQHEFDVRISKANGKILEGSYIT